MADYITEMAQQIVATSRRIDAIESDRVARMAELERMVGDVEKQYGQRIHALENRLPNDAFRDIEFDRDEERRDRWHATYNAALQGAVQAMMVHGGDYDEVFAHDVATNHADRAHGPLEAKASHPGRENDDDPGFHRAVDALVKVAAELDRYCRLAPPSDGLAMLVDDLRRAAKPFETGGGE